MEAPWQTRELRDPDQAAAYLRAGAALARLSPSRDLHLAAMVLSEGVPIPPPGFLNDLQSVLLGETTAFRPLEDIADVPLALLKQYEHQVLGRLIADASLDRAGIAIRRYAADERLKGVAFAARRLCERLHLPSVMMSPAITRHAFEHSDDHDGGVLTAQIPVLIAAIRRAPELLAAEDILALEHRTALGDLAQFVAHRQLLSVASSFAATVNLHRGAFRDVPTRFVEEDHYPVGGYSSIGTKGSMESLLHSQLAYMEDELRPDLFDIKYVREELFYYTRDENQFRRRRRGFGIHFDGSLAASRVKDADAPAQRLVMAQAVMLALVQKLAAALADDALTFHVSFDEALEPERELMAIVLRDERQRGIANVVESNDPKPEWMEMDRAMQFHGITVSATEGTLVVDAVPRVNGTAVPWPEVLEALLAGLS